MEVVYDEHKLYDMMKEFHSITGIRISFLSDPENPVLGVPERNCTLCSLKQQNAEFYQACKACDRAASLEAISSDELYLYECHYHLWEAILPVRIDGELIGYFLLGQILTDRERFIEMNHPSEEEIALLDKMPATALDTLRSYAKLLSWLAHYTILNNSISLRHRETFESISAYIRKHYHENLTVDGLCEHFHYSRSGLFTLFKEECGQGVMEYVNSVRLEASRELLQEFKVVETANMVGISDANYFSRVFKKKYGISPSEYRGTK